MLVFSVQFILFCYLQYAPTNSKYIVTLLFHLYQGFVDAETHLGGMSSWQEIGIRESGGCDAEGDTPRDIRRTLVESDEYEFELSLLTKISNLHTTQFKGNDVRCPFAPVAYPPLPKDPISPRWSHSSEDSPS